MSSTIRMDVTSVACPTQLEGTVDGRAAYFRARSGWWRFTIADTHEEAWQYGLGPSAKPDAPAPTAIFHREGQGDPMVPEARRMIRQMVAEWRIERNKEAVHA